MQRRSFQPGAKIPSPQPAEVGRILAELEAEREALRRQRRRNLLIGGAAVSLLVHLSLLWYLDTIRQHGPMGPAVQAVSVEFNAMDDAEELQTSEQPELSDTTDVLADLMEIPTTDPSTELDTPAVADLGVVGAGSIESLGGAGSSGGDMSLTGSGAASTSFFGVSGRGTRFAFIVDVSGSMSDDMRIQRAIRELGRAISDLPDYTYFSTIFFNEMAMEPPMQRGWTRAHRDNIAKYRHWFEVISPMGGTQPLPGFRVALELEPRPDVIFFMTDGLIPSSSPEDIAALLRGGKRVTVHCIAFGDASSQEMLRRIARESGGTYRFVPSGGI